MTHEVTFITNYVTGQKVTVEYYRALGRGHQAIGVTYDSLGKITLPQALGPIAIATSDAKLSGLAGDDVTIVVPTGRWLEIHNLGIAGGDPGTFTSIDPSDAAAFNIMTFGVTVTTYIPGVFMLHAGDAINLGALVGLNGWLRTTPTNMTRVLREITDVSTFTVTASKIFVCTAMYGSGTSGTLTRIVVDTIQGPMISPTNNTTGAAVATIPAMRRKVFKAGQVLASSSATPIVISGFEVAV